MSETRKLVVTVARDQIGDAYKYAGKGPNNFDCSGLVGFSYNKVGIDISGPSYTLANAHPGIPIEKAQPGDLIFFKKSGRVFHVSILSEVSKKEVRVVHSTSSQGVVEQEIMSSAYWRSKIHKVISLASY